MRITEKGQVTIPKKIRERTGMRPGCEVEFDVKGDTVILRPAPPRARPGMTRGEKIVAGIRSKRTALPGGCGRSDRRAVAPAR